MPMQRTLYRGPLDVARHVLSQQGLTGLYRGLAATLLREVLGNVAMFGVYDWAKQRMAEAKVRQGRRS